MKNNLIKTVIILLAVTFVTLQSCEKTNLKVVESDMLIFEDIDAFNSELEKVLSFTSEELKSYEESKGYKSFGRSCDKIYESIDFESFKSYKELETYINSMSAYLQIVEEENELFVETKLDNNPFRYFMNKDKIFAIGSAVYKGIENYTISTDIEHIEVIKKIDETNYKLYMQDNRLLFSPIKVQTISDNYNKDTQHICGTNGGKYAVDRTDDGRDRTKIEHEITLMYGFSSYIGNYTNVYGRALTRPYKRTLGIWYYCSRTISCNYKIAVGIKDLNNIWSREFYNYSKTLYGSKIEYVFLNRNYLGHLQTDFIHFDGYNSWGDTPSTDPAILQCNTSLF